MAWRVRRTPVANATRGGDSRVVALDRTHTGRTLGGASMILTLTTDDGEVIDEWTLDFAAFYTHKDWSRTPLAMRLSSVTWNLSSALAWAGLRAEIYESAHNRARYDRDERNNRVNAHQQPLVRITG